MKQIFSFGLTAALLLACLTGCGGQAGDTALGGTAPSGGQTPRRPPLRKRPPVRSAGRRPWPSLWRTPGCWRGTPTTSKTRPTATTASPSTTSSSRPTTATTTLRWPWPTDASWGRTTRWTRVAGRPGRQPRHGGRGRFHRGRQDPRRQRGGCVCPGGVRRWPGPLRGGAVPGRHEI